MSVSGSLLLPPRQAPGSACPPHPKQPGHIGPRVLWRQPAGQAQGMPSRWAGGQEDTDVWTPECASSAGLRFPSGKEGGFLQAAKDREEALGLPRWPRFWLPRGSFCRNLLDVESKLSLRKSGKQLALGHPAGLECRARPPNPGQLPLHPTHSQTIQEEVPTHQPGPSPVASQVT